MGTTPQKRYSPAALAALAAAARREKIALQLEHDLGLSVYDDACDVASQADKDAVTREIAAIVRRLRRKVTSPLLYDPCHCHCHCHAS